MQNPSAHEEDTSTTDSRPEGVKVSLYISLYFHFKLLTAQVQIPTDTKKSKIKTFYHPEELKIQTLYIAWQKGIAI